MPAAGEILDSLERITSGATMVAIAWHVVLFAAFAAIVAGFRPSVRSLAWMSILPALSVSAVASTYRAHFNGFVFAALAVVLAVFALRQEDERVRRGSSTAWSDS